MFACYIPMFPLCMLTNTVCVVIEFGNLTWVRTTRLDMRPIFCDKSNRISRRTTTYEVAGACDTSEVLQTGAHGKCSKHSVPCLRPAITYRVRKDINLLWLPLIRPGIDNINIQSSSGNNIQSSLYCWIICCEPGNSHNNDFKCGICCAGVVVGSLLAITNVDRCIRR